MLLQAAAARLAPAERVALLNGNARAALLNGNERVALLDGKERVALLNGNGSHPADGHRSRHSESLWVRGDGKEEVGGGGAKGWVEGGGGLPQSEFLHRSQRSRTLDRRFDGMTKTDRIPAMRRRGGIPQVGSYSTPSRSQVPTYGLH